VIIWSMEQTNLVLLFKLIAVLGLLTLFWPPMRDAWIQAMKDLVDNFRGGPPTPMHPSPADDTVLLRKRRSSKRDSRC
jgi:hypothetical protein